MKTEPCPPPTERGAAWSWQVDCTALENIREAERHLARVAEQERYDLTKALEELAK